MARWGLVPFWADDPAIGHRLVNARAETAATKPAFRAAFRHRRALMPADLFYEWQALPGHTTKQPWCIRLPHGEPFAMAALWEQWTPKTAPDAEPLVTCCLLTTAPNATMRPIHDRMPVILPPGLWDHWLDPATPVDTAQALLRPYPAPMDAHPVSTLVNNPRHEDPACCAPLPPG
jgi:putative SOS response-associated peptidase YedK